MLKFPRMRYHIWTEGCQMNEADSAKLAAGLAKLGWEPADKPHDADLAVVNTCVIRQKAEDRATSFMGHLKKLRETKNPGLQIAVMGCMVGPKTDDLRSRFPYVAVWAQPQNFEVILRHIVPDSDLGGEFWPDTFPEPKGPTTFVPIIHGCNKFCTYCIVPYRRGREKSRTIADIAREVQSVCAAGVREVTLLGQTVEAYGKDLPTNGRNRKPDLADLFEAIHETPGLERIRFLTSYPRDMTERIIRSVAEMPKVCEHFNIPLQSGDNETLEGMRRGYTIEEYLEWVYRIRDIVPNSALSTDVIVGFCGETEAQFQHTLDILKKVRFDKVHVAAYSTRPGTIAWRRMEDDVPQDEKMRRLHAIEEVQERIATEINATFNGTKQEVLIEGAKIVEDGETVYTGRSRGNKLVHFRAPASPPGRTSSGSPEIGSLVNVQISKTTPWSLQGQAASPVPA